MAWFTGLFDLFKGTEKAVAKDVEKTALKSASADVIKTSSKITGSAEAAVTGGRSVLKTAAVDTAKGLGSTAKVGGKVLGATAIIGGTSLAAGSIYNYLADSWAMTTAQREYDNQIKLAGKEADTLKQAQNNQLDYLKKLQELQGSGASAGLAASGGAGDLFPIASAMPTGADQASIADANASRSKMMWLAILGVAAIGAGTFIYAKTKRSK